MNKQDRIYVAGHTGLVGSAVCKRLRELGYENIYTVKHSTLDLRDQHEVNKHFKNGFDYVFLCAGTVGGIMANNTRRAEFIYDNVMMQTNIIDAAYRNGVTKLLAIGSSCIYPRDAEQPIKEEYLLTGELEPTNEPYAVAKIAGIKMCQAYRDQYGFNAVTAMPCNLYGEQDNYDTEGGHVLAAMMRNFHSAKINLEPHVIIWGTGQPMREFMHVDDCADALVFLMRNYDDKEPVNIGVGGDLTIQQLAGVIKKIVGYTGEVYNQVSKPDGMARKLLDSSKINAMGWRPKIGLYEGIERVYKHYSQC